MNTMTSIHLSIIIHTNKISTNIIYVNVNGQGVVKHIHRI